MPVCPNLAKNEFCLQMGILAQWKSARRFYCGSTVDVQEYFALAETFKGVIYKNIDYDQMQYRCFRFAFNSSDCITNIPENYTGEILTIINSESPPTGFVLLFRPSCKTNRWLKRSDVHVSKDAETRHGPAEKLNHNNFLLNEWSPLYDPDEDQKKANRYPIKTTDSVFAVHSPHWPEEASAGWLNRTRSNGFPSRSVQMECLRYGCDFVQKSSTGDDNEFEWRYSFTRAEVFLTKSWTTSQRIVYDTLWIINKEIRSNNDKLDKPNLCSYYFKTLMFWACEEQPANFWNEDLHCDRLLQSVQYMLSEMIKCLISTWCRNYFISNINVMADLEGKDLTREINELLDKAQSLGDIRKIIQECKQCELNAKKRKLRIELPSWMKRAFVIYYQVDNPFDTFSKLGQLNEVEEALKVELSNIYQGLYFQRLAVRCPIVTDRIDNFKRSEIHLTCATNLFRSHDRDTIEHCPVAIFQLIKMKFKFDGETITETEKVEYYKRWPSRSPTVNISWFIAKAYIANIYYTFKCDYIHSLQICDEIIYNYTLSRMNERLAERTFPVILSTRWTSIYDKEIQERLGFYYLCSNLLYQKNDPVHFCVRQKNEYVHLCVCPVQFALYLKVRIARDYMRNEQIAVRQYWEHQKIEHRKQEEAIRQYSEHQRFKYTKQNVSIRQYLERQKIEHKKQKRCECDDQVNNGCVLLNSIITDYRTIKTLSRL